MAFLRSNIAARTTHYSVPGVIAGLGMTGLGVVRSLSPYRIPLVAIDTTPRLTSTYTRLCRKIFVNPNRGENMLDVLLSLGETWRSERPILFLTKDSAVLEVSERREELSRYFRFHLPEREQVHILMDKTAFAEYALDHGLSVPATFVVRGGKGWDKVLKHCPFPCVVKPKYRSAAWVAAGLPKVYRSDSREQLRDLIKILGVVEEDYVVQEWIPGPDSEVFFHLAYYNGCGKPIVSFTGHKLRQYPPSIGSTSMAEPADSKEIDSQAQQLFELMRFKGLGSVEFKRDCRDGRFKITEPTVGRPNLQSEVATANGVNIAYVAYRDLIGEKMLPVCRPVRNVSWVFLENDLASGWRYWRHGEVSLSDFIRSYRCPRYYADLSWHDPLPFVIISLRLIRKAFLRMIFWNGNAAGEDEKQLN